jgi:hypothetical protein
MLPLAVSDVLTVHELKPRAGGIFKGFFAFVVVPEEVARVILSSGSWRLDMGGGSGGRH